jgi:ribosomal-protein-alanine N-acetyltransferase
VQARRNDMAMPNTPFDGINTERLLLRRLQREDAEVLGAYRGDEEIARYQSWDSFSLEHARHLITAQQSISFAAPGAWCQIAVVLAETNTLVGDVAYRTDPNEPRQVELGFTVAREHQGHGYASEAMIAVLDFAFEAYSLHRVHGTVDERNQPAWSLLDRLGFRREGHHVENIWFKGGWGSEFVYAILEEEWRAARASD